LFLEFFSLKKMQSLEKIDALLKAVNPTANPERELAWLELETSAFALTSEDIVSDIIETILAWEKLKSKRVRLIRFPDKCPPPEHCLPCSVSLADHLDYSPETFKRKFLAWEYSVIEGLDLDEIKESKKQS